MFMTNDQLKEMTGYRRHASQIEWLTTNGYHFDVRSDGRPNVLVEQVRERQCKNVEPEQEPDLSWIDEAR